MYLISKVLRAQVLRKNCAKKMPLFVDHQYLSEQKKYSGKSAQKQEMKLLLMCN
jgi:hypothetical protein